MQEHKPLTQFVYESLYADVINGVLTPNDILKENALMERFSVSKSTVREALVSLCDDGVLRRPRLLYPVCGRGEQGALNYRTRVRLL